MSTPEREPLARVASPLKYCSYIIFTGALVLACNNSPEAVDMGEPTPTRPQSPARQPNYTPDPGCQGSDRDFAHRALLHLQGRGARGVHELDVLARAVTLLDSHGLDGRRVVARALTQTPNGPDPRYLRQLHTVVEEILELPRVGTQAMPPCHATRFAAAGEPSLAAFVGDNPPEVPFGAPWGLGDLIESSLRLDDLRPVFLARLLTRVAAPVDGNNVAPEDLERARRTNFGREFEGVFLGRKGECLGCHSARGSVTDHANPAYDRFWPLADLAGPVFGDSTEAAFFAAFRYAGFAEGNVAPWGADLCGEVQLGDSGDILHIPGYLGGHLPAGASALTVVEHLRTGFGELDPADFETGREIPAKAALAGLVASRFADGLWAAFTGHRLTLAHGFPRNRAQQETLTHLTEVFVEANYSVQALAVEVVVHPALNQAPPGMCGDSLPANLDPRAPLPPLLDAMTPDRFPAHPGNGIGDSVVRLRPYALLDRLSEAMGWPTAKRHPFPFTWEDEALYQALGVHLESIRPGHREPDWTSLLVWEDRVANATDPGFAGTVIDPQGDTISRIVDVAYTDSSLTVEDTLLALRDRLLQAPQFAAGEADILGALTGLELSAAVTTIDRDVLTDGLRRAAGAWLATPQFLLIGLAPAPTPAPRIVLPDATLASLCSEYVTRLQPLVGSTLSCENGQLMLQPSTPE